MIVTSAIIYLACGLCLSIVMLAGWVSPGWWLAFTAAGWFGVSISLMIWAYKTATYNPNLHMCRQERKGETDNG